MVDLIEITPRELAEDNPLWRGHAASSGSASIQVSSSPAERRGRGSSSDAWTRNYQPQASSCVLVSAVPKLTIIYTLPKPSSPLPPAVNAKWQTFISGVAAHERVHGGFIRDMVHEIEATSIGFTVANDPDCTKIRIELTKRLGEISARERQRNRDFDKVEMGPGGNVQQLILALVND